MIKKLYNWMLSWSESKWGWLALFFVALFEASWFPLPPDILLIALCIGATHKSFRFATICLAGSVIGGILAYMLGHFAWYTSAGDPTSFAQFFYDHIFSEATFTKVSEMYAEWDFVAIFTAGFTPLPFKIFTIAAGMCKINFVMFIVAAAIARAMRFFLIAWLIWKYGAPIKSFIDKYLNLLATLLAVLLIGITALVLVFLGDEEGDKKSVDTPKTECVAEVKEDSEIECDSTTFEPQTCDALD
jgi:membrane protein YqaA with SNARE-associated domain